MCVESVPGLLFSAGESSIRNHVLQAYRDLKPTQNILPCLFHVYLLHSVRLDYLTHTTHTNINSYYKHSSYGASWSLTPNKSGALRRKL